MCNGSIWIRAFLPLVDQWMLVWPLSLPQILGWLELFTSVSRRTVQCIPETGAAWEPGQALWASWMSIVQFCLCVFGTHCKTLWSGPPVATMVLLCQLEKEHHFLSRWHFILKQGHLLPTCYCTYSWTLWLTWCLLSYGLTRYMAEELYKANFQEWQESLRHQNLVLGSTTLLCRGLEHTVQPLGLSHTCHIWSDRSAWHIHRVALLSITSVVWFHPVFSILHE